MKLYEKIALLRKQHGLSQEDLADKLEISRQSVHKWEQGLCYPEIDKIKRLAQIFNVSYDTLLNDDLYITAPKATVLPKAEIPQAPKYRSVFVSQNELDRYHSDYDHGVILNISKRRYKKADELFDERKAEMENVLKSRNYTYVKAPQPDINVRFFVHEKIGICGFYFDGAEQFVLPVENIINASITEKYTLSISYFTSDGKTDIYNISFSIERLYFNYNEVAKSERIRQALKEELAKRTHEALNEIRNKIIFLKAIGEDIKMAWCRYQT